MLLASAATAAAIGLAGCNTDSPLVKSALRAEQPLSPQTVALLHEKHMAKGSPILVRIFKEEAELEVWKKDETGRYALLKTYPICRWSGELGPKVREGDRQAPEGFYDITPAQLNPNSNYYLAFNMGYPNAYDRAWGRTGSDLMVHGDCSSRGCYAMTDEQIGEIYALARDAFFGGQKAFQVQAYPFRMTPANMARHRGNPNMAFWKMLKRGYDHFAVTRLQPKVDVCQRHYVFDAQAPGRAATPIHFSPAGRCPAYEVPADIAAAVAEKEQRDNVRTAELVAEGTPAAPIKTGTDGGMNPVFLAAIEARGTPGASAAEQAPGSIPELVNPPHAPQPVYGSPNAPAPILASVEPSAPMTTDSAVMTQAPITAAPPAARSGGGFLAKVGSLFGGSGSAAARPLAGTPKRAKAAATRPASAPKPKPSVAASRPRPEPQVATASQPKPKAAQSEHTAARAEHQPHAAKRVARRTSPWALRGSTASAYASAAVPMPMESLAQPGLAPSTSTLMAPAGAIRGAQPARPTGSFAKRWSGLR